MTGDPWQRFLEYAAFARRKPAFDVEERLPRMEICARANAVLDALGAQAPWLDPLDDLLATIHGGIDGPYNPITVKHIRWLRDWAGTDPDSLGQSLAFFLDGGASPLATLAAFDASVQDAAETGVVEMREAEVISFGSLFNFARDPEGLPIVRTGLLSGLAGVLGLEPIPAGRTDLQYLWSLDLVGDLRGRMEDAGIPIRDMLDAQALIFLAAHHRPWWAGDADRPPPMTREPAHTLSVCAIYFNEASYLEEWIEFHRLVGVERFYLYDNGSTDEHADVLDPYVREGSVIVRDWPESPGQTSAYADCLARDRDDSRWIAFIDADEFLFSPTGQPLPELLSAYESHPGVVVNCAMFGPNGHRVRPSGLVTESYMRPLDSHRTRLVKTIADPRLAKHAAGPHHFEYSQGLAVDENHYPVKGPWTKSVSCSTLRINHYVTKSEQEFEAKRARPRADAGFAKPRMPASRVLARSAVENVGVEGPPDSSISVYLPALREAVKPN